MRAVALLWIGAAASVAALVLVLDAHPPGARDALVLRWLRVCAQHPVRSALALGLLLRALSPFARPPTREPVQKRPKGVVADVPGAYSLDLAPPPGVAGSPWAVPRDPSRDPIRPRHVGLAPP